MENIGPQLPEGWLGKEKSASPEPESEERAQNGNQPDGEMLPELNEVEEVREEESSSDEEEGEGVIGPSLPPDILLQHSDAPGPSSSSHPPEDDGTYGPALPPELLPDVGNNSDDHEEVKDESDGEEIGPMLPSSVPDPHHPSYEERLRLLKCQKAAENEKNKRESWMTELPTSLKSYGLGARTFSKKNTAEAGQDKSAWTDTPQEKAAKAAMGIAGGESSSSAEEVLRKRGLAERDSKLAEKASDLNKDRGSSLVDEHRKKRKLDAPEEGSSKERKPFNRDTDMGPCPLSGDKAASVIKRAAQLGNKFSHGSEQKFL